MKESCHRARGRGGCVLAAALAVSAFVADAPAAELCAPRPGQPTPLPRVDDVDPFRARWSALRVRELGARARELELNDPLRAHGFWIRAACLAPGLALVSNGVARTAPARTHRPRVVVSSAPMPPRDDPWLSLGDPVVVVRARGPFISLEERSRARAVILLEIDGLMSQVEERVRRARFDEALTVAGTTRVALDEMRKDSDLPPRWVKLEVLQATAELALGLTAAARASMRRALVADPTLSLDPATTSPKVLRVFESIRGGQPGLQSGPPEGAR